MSLTTFRAAQEGDIAEDPSERADGDTTTWSYDEATGLEDVYKRQVPDLQALFPCGILSLYPGT